MKSCEIKIKANIDTSEVDETIEKVQRLNILLEEANSLVDELASKKLLKINIEF